MRGGHLSLRTLQCLNAVRDDLRHNSAPRIQGRRRASRTAYDAERRTIVNYQHGSHSGIRWYI
ncbi:DUF1534 domain-containing protein [Pseudomonas syringae pv. theae]|nr:DUF1534 domain-containing protein [Pseudomonas syringae pv. theae]MBL3836417.1 DUF1534 domain-containing protein [Pseudomonas syringae pv. theae]